MKKKSEDGPVIKVLKNGPYAITGLDSLTVPGGEDLPIEKTAAICRCGKSSNMPFCDQTHGKTGFNGARLPVRKKNRVVDYRGDGITINDNRSVCSHDGSCFRSLPEVFMPEKWRWIDPKGADKNMIIDTIKKCPSGALSYTVEGRRYLDYNSPPAVFLDSRGPLNVRGGVKLIDMQHDGPAGPESEEHYSLCRCGKSKNKPFCDGSHLPGIFKYEENT